MIELDEDGQLPMVGPHFRICLRASVDDAFGGFQYYLSVITPRNGMDQEKVSKQEQKNESFVAWLTDWFDISKTNWAEEQGLLVTKPKGACVEFGLKTSAYPERYRGAYLLTTYEKFHEVGSFRTNGNTSSFEPSLGVWYLPIDLSSLSSSVKRYSHALTAEEQLGSPGHLSLNALFDWYKDSRPGGAQTSVDVLQRRVAILIEQLMNKRENGCDRLEALSKTELKLLRSKH